MRIQHNIMAMNAYRNYSNNTSALSSNLEKLSSGYKINRAGDDAAGLAISEKMRAQITGLDQAADNVKDGISLVKTAEGALQEVQDMLNRMVELATQSANGTYEDTVDRANLQAEVDALTTEIDRIADSANFNGIKLLDGSLDPKAVTASRTWGDAQQVSIGTVDTTGTHVASGSNVATDSVTRVDPEFTVDLTNVKFTATAANANFTVTIGGKTLTISQADGGTGGTAFAAGDTLSGSNLAAAIVGAVNGNATTTTGIKAADHTTASGVLNGIEIDGLVYKATADGNNVKFTLQTADKDGNNIDPQTMTAGTDYIPSGDVTIAAGTTSTVTGTDAAGHANTTVKAGVGATDGVKACGYLDLSTAGIVADGTKLTIGNATYVFQIGKDSTVTAGTGETAIDMKDTESTDTNLVKKAIAKLTQQTNSGFRLEAKSDGTTLIAVENDYKTLAGDKAADLKTEDGLKSVFTYSKMTDVKASDGDLSKSLTLQIGDTSDSWNQLAVSIKDMHAAALGVGENDISIATATDAQAAVSIIKDAINQVSSTRGTLGATQNRLEHTSNNLSVMSENIQDAESTIRDTDIAEEMMSYTKNNILVQSAQAMLAQANQVPQGVLQLLQ